MKHQHLETITYLVHQFGGKILDISTNNCIVELSAKPTRIDSFMKLITPFGILESARTGQFSCFSFDELPPLVWEVYADLIRTGLMALPRTPLDGAENEQTVEVEEVMDAASLPPS